MIQKSLVAKDQGVSETVGFIIIFGIVLTGIGLVSLYGYPLLLQQQSEANIQNMEKSLIVLQTDINSLVYKNVPYQETAIQVSEGTLSVIRPDAGYDKYFNISQGSTIFIDNFKTGELRYTSSRENVVIGLQNGGVVKWQVGGSAMLAAPRWFYDKSTGTLVITLVQIYSDSPMVQTGIGMVRMKVSEITPSIPPQNFAPPATIEIKYTDQTGDYLTAWRNYLREFDPSMTAGPVSAKVNDVNTLIIRQYNVTILGL